MCCPWGDPFIVVIHSSVWFDWFVCVTELLMCVTCLDWWCYSYVFATAGLKSGDVNDIGHGNTSGPHPNAYMSSHVNASCVTHEHTIDPYQWVMTHISTIREAHIHVFVAAFLISSLVYASRRFQDACHTYPKYIKSHVTHMHESRCTCALVKP